MFSELFFNFLEKTFKFINKNFKLFGMKTQIFKIPIFKNYKKFKFLIKFKMFRKNLNFEKKESNKKL